MADDWYSVDQVADQLGLHVRTVRTYIRDGRLDAVRIGKQYRIGRADLEALTGRPAADRARTVDVTSIVDVHGVDDAAANRIAGVLAGLPGPPAQRPRIETVHDADRNLLKVVLVGGVDQTVELLRFVRALADER